MQHNVTVKLKSICMVSQCSVSVKLHVHLFNQIIITPSPCQQWMSPLMYCKVIFVNLRKILTPYWLLIVHSRCSATHSTAFNLAWLCGLITHFNLNLHLVATPHILLQGGRSRHTEYHFCWFCGSRCNDTWNVVVLPPKSKWCSVDVLRVENVKVLPVKQKNKTFADSCSSYSVI